MLIAHESLHILYVLCIYYIKFNKASRIIIYMIHYAATTYMCGYVSIDHIDRHHTLLYIILVFYVHIRSYTYTTHIIYLSHAVVFAYTFITYHKNKLIKAKTVQE